MYLARVSLPGATAAIICVAAASVVCLSFARPAAAQNGFNLPGLNLSGKRQNKDRPENKGEKLKDFADTPDLPKYTGKSKFVDGILFANASGGPSLTMKFLAQEKPEEVLSWYRNAFSEYHWKIEEAASVMHRVGASKNKNICRVFVDRNTHPKYKSLVILTYRFHH